MTTAIIVTVIVIALLVGMLFALRSNSKTGMPPADVLKRATQRARELDAQDKIEKGDH